MSSPLIILLVLAVVIVIGAGIFFQQRDQSTEGERPKEGPDAPETDGQDNGGGSSDGSGDSGGSE